MPVIRITDATWDRLKRWAIPLEDTPEDALRKVLDAAQERLEFCSETPPHSRNIAKSQISRKSKLRKGVKVPEKAYRRPILEALYELGGSAPVQDVLNVVERKVKSLLTEVDYQRLASGTDIRWRNTAAWTRWKLVEDGLLKNDSLSGIWELSNKGKEEVKSH